MIDPVDSRDAAVLFSHTFLADRRSSAFFDDIARAFRGAGYATLAFDYSGHGRSGDEIITLSTMVEDLRAASGWLADQGHPRQIVHAHEFGATVALEARPPSAVTYILSSPALGPLSYDWTTIFSEVQLSDLERYGTTTIPDDSPSVRRHFTISKQTLADLSMADAEKLLTGLEVPTLITQMVTIIKGTTLAYVLAYPDLMYRGSQMIGQAKKEVHLSVFFQTYIIIAVLYVIVNWALGALARYIESRTR